MQMERRDRLPLPACTETPLVPVGAARNTENVARSKLERKTPSAPPISSSPPGTARSLAGWRRARQKHPGLQKPLRLARRLSSAKHPDQRAPDTLLFR